MAEDDEQVLLVGAEGLDAEILDAVEIDASVSVVADAQLVVAACLHHEHVGQAAVVVHVVAVPDRQLIGEEDAAGDVDLNGQGIGAGAAMHGVAIARGRQHADLVVAGLRVDEVVAVAGVHGVAAVTGFEGVVAHGDRVAQVVVAAAGAQEQPLDVADRRAVDVLRPCGQVVPDDGPARSAPVGEEGVDAGTAVVAALPEGHQQILLVGIEGLDAEALDAVEIDAGVAVVADAELVVAAVLHDKHVGQAAVVSHEIAVPDRKLIGKEDATGNVELHRQRVGAAAAVHRVAIAAGRADADLVVAGIAVDEVVTAQADDGVVVHGADERKVALVVAFGSRDDRAGCRGGQRAHCSGSQPVDEVGGDNGLGFAGRGSRCTHVGSP